MSFLRLAGLSGLVFVALMVINVVLLGDQPLSGDSVDEVRDFIESDEGLHKAAMVFGFAGYPFAVLFFAGVAHLLRAGDRERDEAWGLVALFGAILIGAAAGTGDAFSAALFLRSGEGLDDSTLRFAFDGMTVAYALTGAGIVTLSLSAAIPTLMHGDLPRWHGFLGLVVAVLGALGVISIVSDSNGGSVFSGLAFAGLAVWVLVTAVLILRRPAA